MLLVLAGVVVGLVAWRALRAGAVGRPAAWVDVLLPVGLLCIAVGGLIGARRPTVQRVLIGVALVLAAANLVVAFRR